MSDENWFAPLGEAYIYDDELGRDFVLEANYGVGAWRMVPDWRDFCSLDFDYTRLL